jgi:hypothetical protein
VASEGLHERAEDVHPNTVERHRALVSLREELEAIDWYDQRIDATKDEELRGILTHNRDEEKEHAALVVAWLTKHDAVFAAEIASKVARGEGADDEGAAEPPPAASDGSLGIGSLRGGS